MSEPLPARTKKRTRRGETKPAEATPAAGTSQPDSPPNAVEVLRSSADNPFKFEYRDHTADIQIHSWGESLEEAFEQCALGMFNYMTELSGVTRDAHCDRTVVVEAGKAHDLQSLLFAFMDELLFMFSTEEVVARAIEILRLRRHPIWTIEAKVQGERFSMSKHLQGTEIKAITYSYMQIWEKGVGSLTTIDEDGDEDGVQRDASEFQHPYEVFMIVDI